MDKIQEQKLNKLILFWFGELDNELPVTNQSQLWYGASPQTDEIIRKEYQGLLEQLAENQQLLEPEYTAKQRLGLILLFDQLSRNIYRGQGQAFAYDHLALALCLQGITLKQDMQLCLIERIFFYHPLEHAESLQYQQQCVELMASLTEGREGRQADVAKNSLNYAIEHRDIVQQFGRFPHRNRALGRLSTYAEQQYLDAGGKGFGQ